MSKIYRCKCKNLTNNNICKNKTRNPFYINNKPTCNFHYSYYKTEYALIIQKYYKGYKQRKLLNIVYRKLPDDIQKKIIYNIREHYHYNNYINTIGNIVLKKINNTMNLINIALYNINTTNPNKMSESYYYFNNNNKEFYKVFSLYPKYYYCLKNKHLLNNVIYPEFIKNASNKIQELEYSNYQTFYYLLINIIIKIKNYFNPEFLTSSES